jgi:hypothetical protein
MQLDLVLLSAKDIQDALMCLLLASMEGKKSWANQQAKTLNFNEILQVEKSGYSPSQIIQGFISTLVREPKHEITEFCLVGLKINFFFRALMSFLRNDQYNKFKQATHLQQLECAWKNTVPSNQTKLEQWHPEHCISIMQIDSLVLWPMRNFQGLALIYWCQIDMWMNCIRWKQLVKVHASVTIGLGTSASVQSTQGNIFTSCDTVSIHHGGLMLLGCNLQEFSYCLRNCQQWMDESAVSKPQIHLYTQSPRNSTSPDVDVHEILFSSGCKEFHGLSVPAVVFMGQCCTDIIYELYSGHGRCHLEYATIQVFDKLPPWRRGGFSPGTSWLLFLEGTFLVSEHMQLQWDPGGGRHSGLSGISRPGNR